LASFPSVGWMSVQYVGIAQSAGISWFGLVIFRPSASLSEGCLCRLWALRSAGSALFVPVGEVFRQLQVSAGVAHLDFPSVGWVVIQTMSTAVSWFCIFPPVGWMLMQAMSAAFGVLGWVPICC